MNEFREWLSDNLRYFMLGGGILLALLLIFFGIRFVSSITAGNNNEIKASTEGTPVPTKPEDAAATPTETPAATPTETTSKELSKNAVPEVTAFVYSYYYAIAANDVATLRTLVDTLSAEDEATIANDPVESYSDITVYTLGGLEENSYITYVSYNYKLPGIDTLVPGLSQVYIQADENGDLHIRTSTPDADTQRLIEEATANEDVQQLIAQIQSEYETAINSDDALYAYFYPEAASENTVPEATAEATPEPTPEPTPEATPEPTPEPTPEATPEPTPAPTQGSAEVPEGEWVVLKQAAYIRDCAGMKKSTIIGSYPAGTEMIKLGEEGLWFHVYVDGVYGYISNMFF